MSAFNDRLYNLLPSIIRQRDTQIADAPLRSLLSVISEQVDLVEANIAQLYDDWFIETCQDWVVPYIGDAIGYEVLHEAGEPSTAATAEAARLNRMLIPRQDVANTVHARRCKGTLAVLVELARDVAGWPAAAVEFDRLASITQSLNDLRLAGGRTADVRRIGRLERLGGVDDTSSRTAELRGPRPPGGTRALPTSGVGLFVPRYRSYSVSGTTAAWVENAGDRCFTFSPLQNEVRLFSGVGLPLALHRSDVNSERHYGSGRSLSIFRRKEGDPQALTPVPRTAIVPADLSHWRHEPLPGTVAVDAVLGRLSFPPDEVPADVVVDYHYGFSSDIGAGEYDRIPVPLPDAPLTAAVGDGTIVFAGAPTTGIDVQVSVDGGKPVSYVTKSADTLVSVAAAVATAINALAIPGISASAANATVTLPSGTSLSIAFPVRTYLVQQNAGESHERLSHALQQWMLDGLARAVIEFRDSEIYDENELDVELRPGQILELRAASGTRPVLRIDRRAGAPESIRVRGGAGNVLVVDGLLIAGGGIRVFGAMSHLIIRRSTLVPGWRHLSPSARKHRVEPSIAVEGAPTKISIDRSVIGPVIVRRQERAPLPTPIDITDSIVDAFEHGEAVASPDAPVAYVELRVTRATILGRVRVHAVRAAQNALFCGEVTVTDRQHGYFRYCYVPFDSRTPQRFACQPSATTKAVKPMFVSTRFDDPGYARLADSTPAEIAKGADDHAEMGAFHDLFRAQRQANLETRLAEYVPAGTDLAILFVS